MSEPGSRRAYLIIVLMAANIIFLNADNNIIGAVLTEIEAEFEVDSGQVGTVSFFFSIVGATISLLWGYVADKANRKRLFALSILLAEIPCALTAIAPSFEVFFLLRILTGIGVGASFPIVFSMLGDYFDKRGRILAAAILTTCWGLGGMVGVLTAGYTLDAGAGWRLPFVLVAAPNFLLIVLFLIAAPEPRTGAAEAGVGELVQEGYAYPRKLRISDYASFVKVKTNVYLFLQGIVGNLPWGALFLLIKFLTTEKGFGIGEATTIYAVFGVGAAAGGIAGGIAGGKLFDRKMALQPQFAGIATIAGSFATIAILYLVPSRLLTVSVFGFFAAALVSITGANMRSMLLSVNAPEDRGAIFSIFNLTDSVGFGIGQFFAGQMAVILTTGNALGISIAAWIPCGILLLIASRHFPREVRSLDNEMIELSGEMTDSPGAFGV